MRIMDGIIMSYSATWQQHQLARVLLAAVRPTAASLMDGSLQ
jgi:hypothetical protein